MCKSAFRRRLASAVLNLSWDCRVGANTFEELFDSSVAATTACENAPIEDYRVVHTFRRQKLDDEVARHSSFVSSKSTGGFFNDSSRGACGSFFAASGDW